LYSKLENESDELLGYLLNSRSFLEEWPLMNPTYFLNLFSNILFKINKENVTYEDK